MFLSSTRWLIPCCVWVWRTESTAFVSVHYLSWSGRRPLPCWEPNVMWCRLTHPDIPPPPPLLLTAGSLVDAGAPPRSPQLPRYRFLENEERHQSENTETQSTAGRPRVGRIQTSAGSVRIKVETVRTECYKVSHASIPTNKQNTGRSLIFQLSLNYLKKCPLKKNTSKQENNEQSLRSSKKVKIRHACAVFIKTSNIAFTLKAKSIHICLNV